MNALIILKITFDNKKLFSRRLSVVFDSFGIVSNLCCNIFIHNWLHKTRQNRNQQSNSESKKQIS